MTDIVELQQKLDDLIHKSFDSFVSYKKAAKNYDERKKILERDLDTDHIEKMLKLAQSQKKQLNKTGIPLNGKISLYKKFEEQEIYYEDYLKHIKENNTEQWWIDLETDFLKYKEIFRENKIKLLEKINKILMSLKKKMGENYKEFIKELYLNKLTDDTNTYTYTVKTIMKHLESGKISENAAKKSKKLNELKSRKNIYNRKTQMEIEIEMIKLKNVLEKEEKYKNLFKDKIKKIIDNKDDKKIKNKLFKIVTVNKRNKELKIITNNKGKAIKEEIIYYIDPEEFDKFIGSKNQNIEYQNEIDKYNEKLKKLNDKKKFIENKIAKLKGISLNKLNSSVNNGLLNNLNNLNSSVNNVLPTKLNTLNAVDNGFQVPKNQSRGREKELKKLPSKLINLRDEITQLEIQYNELIQTLEDFNEKFKRGILGFYRHNMKFKGLEKDAIIETKSGKEYIKPDGIDAIYKLENEDKAVQNWINQSKKIMEQTEDWAGEVLEKIEEKELLFHQLSMALKNSKK
jgi:hypothetical protein